MLFKFCIDTVGRAAECAVALVATLMEVIYNCLLDETIDHFCQQCMLLVPFRKHQLSGCGLVMFGDEGPA